MGIIRCQGYQGQLLAVAASGVPEDSASDIDSGPLLLPANGEAASGTSAQGKEAPGRGISIPSSAEPIGTARLQAQILAAPQQAVSMQKVMLAAEEVMLAAEEVILAVVHCCPIAMN
ncbi:TPA: hypothetical protein ACH3X3_002716 [Trebouxia sp. C0006]